MTGSMPNLALFVAQVEIFGKNVLHPMRIGEKCDAAGGIRTLDLQMSQETAPHRE